MLTHVVPLVLALGGPSETTRVEVHETDVMSVLVTRLNDPEVTPQPTATGESSSTGDPSAETRIARVAFDRGAESTHIFAYDGDEQVAAEIVLWYARDEGHAHIAANFPDGVFLAATFDHDQIVAIDNDHPEVTSARLAAVLEVLGRIEQASWLKCAGYAAMTAWEASHGSPIALPYCVLAVCECLPEFIELAGGEWEGCW
jgi:hypothetical protein